MFNSPSVACESSFSRHEPCRLTSNAADGAGHGQEHRKASCSVRLFRTACLASVSAVALLLAAPQAFARPLGGYGGGSPSAAAQAQQAAQQAAQNGSLAASNALKRATQAVQAMQATQAAARNAALQAAGGVPNGLTVGGLQVAPGATPGSSLWQGAQLPTQAQANGRTQVEVRQFQQKAILTWQTFNVGSETDLRFDQQGNRNWVALNRVLDTTAPSRILGTIKADGSVYVINRNGIIFGGASQVNVGSLIASSADIADTQFLTNGIYSAQAGGVYLPSFTGATGKITVEAGAQISTAAPASVTAGGGFVALLGTQVDNAGAIATPKGQAILAAGDDFILRPGFGTTANVTSTTRGSEIAPVIGAGSASGNVTNTGLIFAQQGDITLAGRTLMQDGVLLSTTSVNTRGTIHLLNAASDAQGSITLGASSLTDILPELDSTDTALNTQRDALIAASAAANLARAGSATGAFDNLSLLADRQDQSRIEIVSGGDVVFKGGSLTQAQGGQVAVSAGRRVFTESGATIDVSGVRDVAVAMAANNIQVNVQGNELRDSPVNRDSGNLLNANVWIDLRDLILVPAGTGGYASDRYYTPGGLLEVSGYVNNTAHTIGEWSALGGTITLAAPEVIAQQGSVFDISGGSVAYQGGYIRTSNFRGADGRSYNVGDASANMLFTGIAGGWTRGSARWNVSETWTSVFNKGAVSTRWEDAYTVGRDAGSLVLSTPTAIFEGDILAAVVKGGRQLSARPDGVGDGYKLPQNAAPLAGTLAIGRYDARGLINGTAAKVTFDDVVRITAGMNAADAVPAGRTGTVLFDAGIVNKAQLGGLNVASDDAIAVNAPLTLAPGAVVTFTAPDVGINADITAHGGRVTLGNIMSAQLAVNLPVQYWALTDGAGHAQVSIGNGATVDLTGLWTNAAQDPSDQSGLAFVNGGRLKVATTGGITVASGTLLDVSSGGAMLTSGKIKGGKGGDVSLIANDFENLPDGGFYTTPRDAKLILDGRVQSYGFNGGGTLTLNAGQKIVIGGGAQSGDLHLDTALFASGFTAYDITGIGGVAIGDGTAVAPTVPVYRADDGLASLPTGSRIAADLWLPPAFLGNPIAATVTPRAGADLTLVASNGDFTLGQGASIAVDPGHAVNIYAYGQTTIDGTITAKGGNILVAGAQLFRGQWRQLGGNGAFSLTRSIWIGDDAVLDVSGYAATVTDLRGRVSGMVADGGSIALGGANGTASDAFVVIRPGALLDASGTAATIDILDGNGATPTVVASDGGSIALNSNSGIYIDGTMRAAAGGAGASGGTLSMNLVSRVYSPTTPNAQVPDGIGTVPEVLRKLRDITVTQQREASGLSGSAQAGQADSGLLFGNAAISAEQIAQGGFASLALRTSDLFVFKGDVNLALARSIAFGGGIFSVSDATPNISVALAAPYVRIDGFTEDKVGATHYNPGLTSVLPSAKLNSSTLSVAADLLDITGGVRFGASGQQGSGYVRWVSDTDNTLGGGAFVDAGGFAQVNLMSRGDIRFGNGRLSTDSTQQPGGWLKTSGDLTLTAAQIYPLSGASVAIYAGLIGSRGNETFDPARQKTITIRRSSGDIPQQPASVFGNLSLIAATIDQGGVVRAPLGRIIFNGLPDKFTEKPDVTTVIFRAGSVTSATANGLIMPFGGTADGTSYQGADGTLVDLGSALVSTANGAVITTGISVTAGTVIGEKGAVLDLSGGGSLTGAGFVSGRGGSVDTLKTPLINANPVNTFSSAGNKVYAIMPGYASAYGPAIATNGAGDPNIGRQITIPAGVPGLPAGNYTLLPSSYALLPGAFRVELGGSTNRAMSPFAMANGSYVASGILGVANTGIRDALPTELILSAGQVTRSYSQYNETSYADFARSKAALFGNVRPRLPDDGKILQFNIGASTGAPSLSFDGTANFDPANDGIAGSLLITSSAPSHIIDITAPGVAPIIGHSSISTDDLNAFHAASLFVGGGPLYVAPGTTSGGVEISGVSLTGGDSVVNVLDGAYLQARQVFLIGSSISVAGGAAIDTRGQSRAGLDSSLGYVFRGANFLAVANGRLNFLPSTGTGSIMIATGASLLTDGGIVIGAPGSLSMGDVNFGARYLSVTLNTINAGDPAALAAAQAAGVLPNGWTLNQAALDRLLRPSSTAGVPALEQLTLTVGGSINLFGSVTLDARSQSTSDVEFVLNTPAIYGLGSASDTAMVIADRLFWNGIRTGYFDNTGAGTPHYGVQPPAPITPNGAGTGAGNLVLQAQDVTFGYDKYSRQSDGVTLDRIAVGFANVAINATDRITGNSDGTLSVGLSKDPSGKLIGGNLTLSSPLITAEAGATIDYTAGGAIRVVTPAGSVPSETSVVADQGGTLSFKGDSVFVDTAFALPSGKLTLTATNDIVLGGNARVDLAGRAITFYDITKFGWGGDLMLQSANGNITQAAGSLIDVSATYNQAGSIAAVADDGVIALDGTLRGSTADDAQSGRIGLRAASLGDFTALNAMLNQAGFFGGRAFVLKQGDLVVGAGVRAHTVSISVDNGSLTVNGTIDASGAKPGSIRLAARDDLTLASTANLDTHSTVLQTDSYGAPIEANNTAHVDLTSSQGWVNLAPGASIDMRSADGIARGKLEINAPRLGSGSSATGAGAPDNATGDDIAISAAGPLNIRGAASVAVNGFATYTNAPADPDDANGQIIDQAWLDLVDEDSTVFYNAALGNTNLQARLAGLKNIAGSTFHLRPGVTIASATPNGNLTVKGDLDFSNYRYGLGADTQNHTGLGEVGVINFRAGGTLTVKGSINDGFAPPPVSPDALTTLFSGTLGADYTVTTGGVTLGAGWLTGIFNDWDPAVTVGFDIPLGPGFLILIDPTPDHPIPIDIPLAQDLMYGGFGDPLGGDIRDANGHILYRATDILDWGTIIPAGSVLGRGINSSIGGWGGIYTSLTAWPANTDLYMIGGNPVEKAISLPPGTVLPFNFSLTDITLTGPGDRKVWATSAMQTPGAQSWSMRLVGGADLTGADSRALQATTKLASGTGNVVLNDPFTVNLLGTGTSSAGVSVVRTGTGNLEILAGGSYRQDSPYGVYTAGTAIAVDSAYNTGRALAPDGTVLGSTDHPQNADYEATLKDAGGNYRPRMYYTENGGDFLLVAQGDIGGKQKMVNTSQSDSTVVGNWLWRQGGNGQATAWGINFGSYVGTDIGGGPQIGLAAFSGMGALGGGNVTLQAGGDIGNAGQGVVVAIGGSGRVTADGQLIQTGGGTLSVVAGGNVGTGGNQFVNLRGDTQVAAGDFGSLVSKNYGYNGQFDPRPLDPFKNFGVAAFAGGSFAPGDGAIAVRARGDLAMGSIDDPGRVTLGQDTAGGANGVKSSTWFTLWTGRTVIDLTAAGGDASPLSPNQSVGILPSVLRVTAASGDIFLNPALDGVSLMMPSPDGELQLLAQGSVIEVNSTTASFGPLSTSLASIATPFRPAWAWHALVGSSDTVQESNLWAQGNMLRDQLGATEAGINALGRLFAFGPDTTSDASAAGNGVRSKIYALTGDISGLRYGEVYHDVQFLGSGYVGTDYYRAAKPIDIIAGGDIFNIGGLILHSEPTDVSTIAAGGNVIYAGTNVGYSVGATSVTAVGLQIAGPGTLEVTAGGNIYQGSLAGIESIGALVQGDSRPGASVVLQAGVGQGTPGVGQVDWTGFAKLYLDPANRAGAGPLADQPGKVAKTYDTELVTWLKDRFGYSGADADALAYFNALPGAQQRVFLRQVYYAELTAGGREYNDKASSRFGSYLRGREAIAALFPAGNYAGDITMFSAKAAYSTTINSGFVHTDFGGDIQFLTPGGKVVVGTEGLAPGADAGLITQGQGEIQVYSKDSVLLGLSRIMTTFGGDILIWSAEGDINAGRGSKTTVLYTPPKRTYDIYGNVTLSPVVPSSGAGIATLNPIPEVKAGNIDLIAPLGTIDAGEAGIRVSGNVNLAALQVVNAANIQVQGTTTGVPVVQLPNVSGALAASNTAGAAQQTMTPAGNGNAAQPSIIIVEVLGFGGDDSTPENHRPDTRTDVQGRGQESRSAIEVIGAGELTPGQRGKLTETERRNLGAP
ncbi:filamentous hemagglutinin N-terminal domain-containing protein [Pseudolabrys taiwanensis]|uniref:Filamentous hemagglutinin N-terminal domain-containing protein n=1 Tax=Pseudolabrys taiwanensis TaxID=331696 RepID=A0A345ZQW3_9HYPH|nr:filamentous hemagglutinin N-terminal domain-containing protein [Pseudolabrys taiwanensis]